MSDLYAVIGSNAFSGSSFIDHLLRNGESVLAFSRSNEGPDAFLPYKWGDYEEDRFEFQEVDLNYDAEKLIGLLDRDEPPYIVNFSAQGMVEESWRNPEDWYKTNVMAQVNLVEQLKDRDYLKRFIQFTTPEVYGSTTGWITETNVMNPTTPYAVSRAAFDFHLTNMFDAYNFPVIFTRAANVYGAGQQLYRIIPRAILSIILHEKLPLHGDGTSERAFIHIQDVAKALSLIFSDGVLGDTYHISTNSLLSIRELVQVICDTFDYDIEELVEVVDERRGKDQAYMLDSSKLRNNLQWKPSVELDQGIKQVWHWVTSNIDELKQKPRNYIHKRS